MSHSIHPTPPLLSKGQAAKVDRRQAKRIILEIVRQAAAAKPGPPGLTREVIAVVVWFAHLHFAKSNPGYLTTWPLVRTSWGIQIRDASSLLPDLVEEECIRAEPVQRGPFSVTVYHPTPKEPGTELPPAAIGAIGQAIADYLLVPQYVSLWPFPLSRTWRDTPIGEEIDIYLDLIPDEEYEQRRRQMEGLRDALGDLFS